MLNKKLKKYQFQCKRIIRLFPDGIEDKNVVLSQGNENESYLSDVAVDYYDNDGKYDPYRIFKRDKISCI